MNYDDLTAAEKQAYMDLFSYLEKQKISWVGNDQVVINPGDTIELNWSHKDSKVLGKVKGVDFHNGEGLTVNLATQEWIDKLKDYLFEEENRYRAQHINLPGTVIAPAQFAMYSLCLPGCTDEDAYKSDAIDAYRYAFENLKSNLRSAQDQEITKYTIKDETELSTPYDIWEKNKIEKGELSMNTYDVAYNEKKAAAQKAYDEALIAAKKEKEEAAQKEANETAAKTLKSMYDAYVNAGFTPEQAEKFVTIALEKVASKI